MVVHRYLGLDFCRGLAILLVLASHTVIYYGYTSSVNNVALNCGYCGVTLFFVLSGFLITKILIAEMEKFNNVCLYNFYWRRCLRLFPALWAYLITLVILWFFGVIEGHPFHGFLTAFFYIRNLFGRGHETDHLWSLSIEEQFYLIWPLIFIFLKTSEKRFWFTLVFLVLVGFWRIIAGYHNIVDLGKLYIRSDFRFDSPLAGCLLAQFPTLKEKSLEHNKYLGIVRKPWLSLLIALSLGLVIIFVEQNKMVSGLWSSAVIVLSSLLVWALVYYENDYSFPLLKIIVKLGYISYGVYLWQQLFLGPNIGLIGKIRNPLSGLFLSFAFALISYFSIEKRCLSFKSKFYQKG